jgi:hypothetical protein
MLYIFHFTYLCYAICTALSQNMFIQVLYKYWVQSWRLYTGRWLMSACSLIIICGKNLCIG